MYAELTYDELVELRRKLSEQREDADTDESKITIVSCTGTRMDDTDVVLGVLEVTEDEELKFKNEMKN
jgi:hypothetical protein